MTYCAGLGYTLESTMKKARDSRPVPFYSRCGQGQARMLGFLECRARGRGSGTTRVVTDDARLVGEERALAALAHHARYRCPCIGDVQSASSRDSHGREFITALHCRH